MKAIGRLAAGGWFRTTLVPLRTEPTRLYMDTRMRGAAGMGRKEILTYLNFLKTPAALERNVQKVMADLLSK